MKYFPKCSGKGSFPKSQIKSLDGADESRVLDHIIGISIVNTLNSGGTGMKFGPHLRGGAISVSEKLFLQGLLVNKCAVLRIRIVVVGRIELGPKRPNKIGTVSGSGTGPLDYGATGPVPDTKPCL